MRQGWKRNKNNLCFVTYMISVGLTVIFSMISLRSVCAYDQILERIFICEEKLTNSRERSIKKETETVMVRETAKMLDIQGKKEEMSDDIEELNSQNTECDIQNGEQTFQVEFAKKIDQMLDESEDVGEQWAISILNLSDGAIYNKNADISMQSASVIKVFIMAAIYGRVCYPDPGHDSIYMEEQYEGELKELLINMITVSDNDAANRLVELLGTGDFEEGKAIVNEFCQENGYTGTHLGRRFLQENPVDDNYTTASDCQKILSDIYTGDCVCEEASAKMLTMLQGQTRVSKIPAGLPEGISSANKTGEMSEGYGLGCIENDIAIIYGEKADYILCILANNLAGKNKEACEKIRDISSYVYEILQ